MTTINAALALAEEHGIPVFPCSHNKKPLTEHGFQDAATGTERIAQWWDSWPHALVGVPTGRASKLLVIDIDPEGAAWYAENADRLGCGRVHKTARGHHLLYRMPEDEIRNSASQIARGVDVRGEGGYIIWWPAEGHEAVGDLLELPEPPAWVIEELRKGQPASNVLHLNPNGKIPEGARNETLFRMASRLRRMGLDAEEISAAVRAINIKRCTKPISDREVALIAASAERYKPEEQVAAPAAKIVLRHIADIVAEKRESNWLIYETLEHGVIAVIAGARGTFKSFIALHWAMLAALDGHPMVMLSGEGGGLDRRVDAWMRTFAPNVDLRSLPVVALERALNLNSEEVMQDLQAAINESGNTPHLVVIDTYSKFSPGIDENDNGEVAAFIQKLSYGLREKYGCTVALVAHSGHGDAKRPRGASALMANPDAEYIVDRPDITGMLVTVSRERFKDSPSLSPLAYKAESVDLGRLDQYGKAVTSLVVRGSDVIPMRAPPTGKAQRALLAELERLVNTGVEPLGIWTQEVLREKARVLGFSKSTSRDAVIGLVNMQFLKPTVGGYKLG
jgi:hypothetical protein